MVSCGARRGLGLVVGAWVLLVGVLLPGHATGAVAGTSATAPATGSATYAAASAAAARVPSACRSPGFTICVNKNTRLLYAFRSGRLVRTFSARFGSSSYPTRNGWFHVTWKSRWHYSSKYHSAMPFSLFFSGGQAIHYSSNFARVGYGGASHGCINLRSWSGAQWVFDNARVGTTVYVGRW